MKKINESTREKIRNEKINVGEIVTISSKDLRIILLLRAFPEIFNDFIIKEEPSDWGYKFEFDFGVRPCFIRYRIKYASKQFMEHFVELLCHGEIEARDINLKVSSDKLDRKKNHMLIIIEKPIYYGKEMSLWDFVENEKVKSKKEKGKWKI